jgi:hypothetical protein
MKGLIVSTLRYPCYLLRDSLDIEHCVHGGNFNTHDQRCLECDCEFECRWLCENDECTADNKTVAQLMLALETSQEYIDRKIAVLGHNISECPCDACTWLRQAEALYNRYHRETRLEGRIRNQLNW